MLSGCFALAGSVPVFVGLSVSFSLSFSLSALCASAPVCLGLSLAARSKQPAAGGPAADSGGERGEQASATGPHGRVIAADVQVTPMPRGLWCWRCGPRVRS
eukprot:3823243-Rhodomonas_salina.1